MIQKLQNFFHTDKWWGKCLFISLLYILYWLVFYVFVPFIVTLIQGFNFGGPVLLILVLGVAPVISFIIPRIITKVFLVNKIFLYIFHILLIIITPAIFFYLIIFIAFRNFGGF
jgi:hypothetical protein